MLLRLLGCAFLVTILSEQALASCEARVKVVGSDLHEDSIILSVRVWATQKERPRSVSYLIYGEYRARDQRGKEFNQVPLTASAMITVEQDDEFVDDTVEVSTAFIGKPISSPKIRSVTATNCFPK